MVNTILVQDKYFPGETVPDFFENVKLISILQLNKLGYGYRK
jgi:hypothetical protein